MIRETTNAEKRRHSESVLAVADQLLASYSDARVERTLDRILGDVEESGEVEDGQA